MKRFFHFMPIAVAMAAAAIISCQKIEEELTEIDEPTVEEPSIASLTFTISDNESTKTVIAENEGKKYSNWETGDKIGYVTSKSDNGSTTVTIGTPSTFTISPTSGFAVDDVVEVWYPYRKDETNKASVQMLIPVSQIQDGDSFDFDAMPMVAEPITITSEMLSGDDYAGTINFANLASLIEFKIFSTEGTYASEKVAAITFDAGSSNIAGHFNMNVGAVDFDTPATLAFSGHTAKSVTTSLTSPSAIGTSKATAKNVYMVVAPGTYTGNIIVATDAAFYTIPISGKEFERSGFKSFGIDLAKSVATRRSTKGSFTFQLNQVSYSSASEASVVWKYGLITLEHSQNPTKTAANQGIPPGNGHSRFYAGNNVIFTPLTSTWTIDHIEVTATTAGYASAFAGGTWDNAISSSSDVIASLSPVNSSTVFENTNLSGQARVTSAKVYFDNTNYTITDGTITGEGTLSYSTTSAKVNTTITITATPGSGQILNSLTVKDSEDHDVTVTLNQFKMPASDVTVFATFVDGSSPSISMATNAAEDINTAAGTTATLSGTISLDGGAVIGSVTEAGFYYKAVGAANYTKVTLGSAPSTTTYTYALAGLTPGTEYTYYSYAVYDSGSAVFGDATEKTFTPLKMFAMTIDNHDSGNNNVHWNASHTTLTYSGVTWTTSVTWKASEYYGTTKNYASVGSTGNPATNIQLQTSGISGTIKSVSVDCASGSAKHKVTITVNGDTYTGANNVATPSWSNESSIQPVTGTGSSSGTISITLSGDSKEVKAAYFKKITVLYY